MALRIGEDVLQLELFNLLTPSATVNLPSPMQNGADGFDDILHQAQGLDLVDLSNTVDLQPDAPQMMSLDQPTALVDMASAMVAMASLDAANLDRSSGQSLPVDTLVDNEEMLLRLQAFVAQVAGMQSTEEMTGTLRQFDQVDNRDARRFGSNLN